jgi:hypothetical protein
MSDEPKKCPTTVSRDDLYRQVWDSPASRLCEQYGISGRGLKKICDRLKVPCPPRGYWARRAAGQMIKQAPLPEAAPSTPIEATITPTPALTPAPHAPELDQDTAEKLSAARAAAAQIRVPKTLHSPHWAIAAWIKKHQQQVKADKRDRWRWGSEYRSKPFNKLERRQQRFLSTLLKEAEKLGYKVKGEAPYELLLESGRNTVEFKLRERIKQIRRPLTDKEKANQFYSNQNWRQERIATGELVFGFDTHIAWGLRREWHDREQLLEQQIGEIVAVLAVAAPILEKRRLEADKAERLRWQEEQRRREAKEREDQDYNRWRRFIEFARLWEEAQLAGNFLQALEKIPQVPEETYGKRTSAEWMNWAWERQQAFDPTNWNIASIWKDLASVTAWETPRSLFTVRLED